MLIPPSGRGWPSTCRPPHISTGYQPRLRGMFTYPEPFDRT